MSEFSESFHLHTHSKNEGHAFIRAAGVDGIVFEGKNNWVTVLLDGELNSHLESVPSIYTGTVLHYMYAEDHAWMVNVFENSQAISRYLCAWDPELYIEDEGLDIEVLANFSTHSDAQQALGDLFTRKSLEEILNKKPAYEFAALVGLPHYQWLSGINLTDHSEEIVSRNQGAELVSAI